MNTSDTRIKVLILDDEEMIGQTMAAIVGSEGMAVQLSQTAEAFLQQLDEWQPDAVVLDLMLPGTDGVDVINSLGRLKSHAGLIVTSGLGTKILNSACEAALQHGLNVLGALPKPFTPSDLRLLLKKIDRRDTQTRRAANEHYAPHAEELRRAIEQHQLFVVYQPKVRCDNGALAGFEALVRWQHPEHGVVPPDQFIRLAEEHNCIDELTRSVVSQALSWFAPRLHRYQHSFNTLPSRIAISLSFNISAISLRNSDLFDWIFSRCQDMKIPPETLIFELTESSAMHDPASAYENLTRLRMRGFRLSIDDFGTGYSSMVQLVKLPFSELKIDKSFVSAAKKSDDSRAIVRVVVDLGRSLNMTTIAEGIEDKETLELLASTGCSQVQGYYISRPLAPDAVDEWYTAREQQRETNRISALRATGLLDSAPESRFDIITHLAKNLLKAPIALVTLVDENRQWFKSADGLSLCETTRQVSFCAIAIQYSDIFAVPDTLLVPELANNPLVTDYPHIRAYAGVPLVLQGGHAVGTLCVIDNIPRQFSTKEISMLTELGKLAQAELVRPSDILEPRAHGSGYLEKRDFRKYAQSLWELCKKLQLSFSVVYIKVKGLEVVNEHYGRHQGDYCLNAMASIMGEFQKDVDLLGRFRNTLITMLLINVTADEIDQITHSLQEKVNDWLQHNPGQSIYLTPETGSFSVTPSADDYLEHTLYRAI